MPMDSKHLFQRLRGPKNQNLKAVKSAAVTGAEAEIELQAEDPGVGAVVVIVEIVVRCVQREGIAVSATDLQGAAVIVVNEMIVEDIAVVREKEEIEMIEIVVAIVHGHVLGPIEDEAGGHEAAVVRDVIGKECIIQVHVSRKKIKKSKSSRKLESERRMPKNGRQLEWRQLLKESLCCGLNGRKDVRRRSERLWHQRLQHLQHHQLRLYQ
jgi:hypothetical protein